MVRVRYLDQITSTVDIYGIVTHPVSFIPFSMPPDIGIRFIPDAPLPPTSHSHGLFLIDPTSNFITMRV
jgi:hypothetical protein